MIEIGNVTGVSLPLGLIRIDGGTQSRTALVREKIDEYAQLMREGTVFPPVIVYYDGSDYWLADGFHRYHASHKIDIENTGPDRIIEDSGILVEIKQGSRRDAVLYSMGANTRHGIPLPLSDRKRCANAMLEDEEWSQWSDRKIAKQCGLHHETVGAIRREIYGDNRQNVTNQPEKPVDEDQECVTLRTPREVVAQWFADNPELEHLSNREIARRCGVTEGTVRNYRKELQDEREKAAQENAEVESLKEPEAVSEPASVVETTSEPEPPSQPAIDPEPESVAEVIETTEPEPEPEPATSENAEVEDVACEDEDEDVPEPEPTETVADPAIEMDEDEEDYDESEDVTEPEPVSEPEQPIEEHTVATPEPEPDPEPDPVEDTATPETEPAPGEQEAPAPAVVPTDDVEEQEEEKHIQSQGLPPALTSSESNEWYTPAQYVYAARELMRGIDVDPASNATANQIIKALTYYDIESNGLDKPWYGRVWLNPPYGRDNGGSNQEVWSHRLLEQYKAGITKEAVLLVNANTEAKWFQPFYDYLICFTNHRIKFYSTDGTPNQPTQGNALIYLGNNQDRFIEIFEQFGVVLTRAKRKIA